jgi:hypothetical protein
MVGNINIFVHKPIIHDIITEFDYKFNSNMGCPVISRTLMMGVTLYAFNKIYPLLLNIIDLADSDRYLRTFTCNTRITNTTLKRFL